MRTRVFVAVIAAVALGVVAATASASGRHSQANKLTVWLQVDAQSGWPDIVAAANAQFAKDHPGYTVDVQYQTWGDHLQKFDATLAGGNSPDVIEMGNTEMTKYMAAGAFADITRRRTFDNSANWLRAWRRRALRRQALRRSLLRRLVVTYRTDAWAKAGSRSSNSLAQFAAARSARREEQASRLLARLHRRHRLVLRDELRHDFGGTIARTQGGSGSARSTHRGVADSPPTRTSGAVSKASKTSDENHRPYDVYRRAARARSSARAGSAAASATSTRRARHSS